MADNGSSIQNSVLEMCKFGLCREDLWPYKDSLVNKTPPYEIYKEARRYTVTALKIPFNITAIKTSLAKQIPVLVGIKIKNGRRSGAKTNGGYIPFPDKDDTLLDHPYAHAGLLVGYDDDTQHFIVRNSWGSHWVRRLYFRICDRCEIYSFLGTQWILLCSIQVSVR